MEEKILSGREFVSQGVLEHLGAEVGGELAALALVTQTRFPNALGHKFRVEPGGKKRVDFRINKNRLF